MDRTKEYKSCLKAIQSLSRAASGNLPKTDILTDLAVSSSVVRKIETKAHQIQTSIRNLENVLRSNRDSITNFSPYRAVGLKQTDFEVFDAKITTSIDQCLEMIGEFWLDIGRYESDSEQELAYYKKVAEFLRLYLHRIRTEFLDQKSKRVKRSMQLYELAKLNRKSSKDQHPYYKTYKNKEAVAHLDDYRNDDDDDNDSNPQQLTHEELQKIEQENQLLFNDLNSYANEIEHLESQVVEIARLQQALTENILEQDETVDRVAGSVFGLNANICEGNELIRDGIRRDASFRFWLMFFLFVLSLTILFLNWYND